MSVESSARRVPPKLVSAYTTLRKPVRSAKAPANTNCITVRATVSKAYATLAT